MNNPNQHRPVMLREALAELAVVPDEWYLDATFGSGGHSEAILAAGGQVLALDWDLEAIERAETSFAPAFASGCLRLERENFSQLESLAQQVLPGVKFAGILFDFGTSSEQLLSDSRGFSFQTESALDMRMDTRLGVRAADLLAVLTVKQLTQLFQEYGGESEAHRLARAIKTSAEPIETTQQLANLVTRVKRQPTSLHPATKVFQALRIAVNTELDNITAALPQALGLLKTGGRLVTISFHEGEDGLVKHFFKLWAEHDLVTILTKKPLTPNQDELRENPRARSSKLRSVKKI